MNNLQNNLSSLKDKYIRNKYIYYIYIMYNIIIIIGFQSLIKCIYIIIL